jgi:glycerophosphoryl diester phosphodiesterase
LAIYHVTTENVGGINLGKTRLKGGRVYIASHSGIYAGNLVRNTMPSFQAALRQGAGILEADVSITTDGELFIFHDGFEKILLQTDRKVRQMTSQEVRELQYVNLSGNKINHGIDTLDMFLEEFKNTVLINLDRCWGKFPQVIEQVRKHSMEDQIILKSAPKPEHLETLQHYGSDIMYMPVLKTPEDMEQARRYDLNMAGAELLFSSPQDEIVYKEQMEAYHRQGLLLWGNAIVYDIREVIGGGYTDDISLTLDCDKGWGKLIDMGFDIIQTDFPGLLRQYINSRIDTFNNLE